ncbi:MAG: cardiolipin synthase B [Dokdonella sp.]
MSIEPNQRTAIASNASMRLLAAQAFSRTAGAPLIGGNAVDLLIDARANYDAWLSAIASARQRVLFENYIFRNDDTARAFRDALIERADAGVEVLVIRDWLGCLGQSFARFWQPLIAAGGQLRTYNPPKFGSPLGWLSRDHRKLLVVDHSTGFISGICVSSKWLGDASRKIEAWRDTGVAIRGPAVQELVTAFADIWARLGSPIEIAPLDFATLSARAGDVDLRVIATVPNAAGLYRLDQLIAAMAQDRLWLTDAYFVGVAPYVQALVAAARDGVDVRLLVPGTSDIPAVGSLSRSGYRPLLEAGIRVFEWNGSMLHAKTAVADGRWARVGSSNLNLASWIGNCEIDVAIENASFADAMEQQYEKDLDHSTEIVLHQNRRQHRQQRREDGSGRPRGGSTGRAAAGALRLANSVGAAITNRRVLGRAENGIVVAGALFLIATGTIALIWPRTLAWPVAVLALWFGASLLFRYLAVRRKS